MDDMASRDHDLTASVYDQWYTLRLRNHIIHLKGPSQPWIFSERYGYVRLWFRAFGWHLYSRKIRPLPVQQTPASSPGWPKVSLPSTYPMQTILNGSAIRKEN